MAKGVNVVRVYTGAEDRALERLAMVFLVATALTATPLHARAGNAETESFPGVRHVWLDAAGQPLPFQGHAKIEEFLRTARVEGREEIGVGINKLDRLLLEKDGVQAHAIFRDVDETLERVQVGDRHFMRFKDSYEGECAAYAVARLFGLDRVPPTVERVLDRRPGSMQIWVENARDPSAAGFRAPHPIAWVRQTWGMFIFDNLVFNVDRNTGNILAGQDYWLWLIDHTRAFQPTAELLAPEKITGLSRRAWNRILEASAEEVADATREYLDPDQVVALKERRKLLVAHIQTLIQTHGEDAVLF